MIISLAACDNGASNDNNKNNNQDHTHFFEEWQTAKKATCTEDGTKVRYCSCGEMQTQTISALGHTEVIDAFVEPTCTTEGLTEGKHCSVCNEILVQQTEINKLEHNYIYTSNPPTCIEDGYITSICDCGETLFKEIVPADGHEFENGVCVYCYEDDPDYTALSLSSTTYNINLTDYSDVAYITMIGGETVTYDIDDESVVSCEWGEWDGDIIPLTFTPVSSGNTVVTVYIKDYDVSITINVSVEMTEGDIWRYNYYVDSQFGFATDEWYLTTVDYIEGTFSNSATTNDELYVELLYDCNDEISIFLYEYANISYGLVKNNSSSEIDYYEDGYIYSARGQMHPGGDRIYIIDTYHKAVLNLMRTSEKLQFYIENESFTTTQYKFDVDMNNFDDVLHAIIPEDEHLHSYTTSTIGSTCLENGYTLYSCECGDYFCDDFMPLLEHNLEHGTCSKCDTVIDAYLALAYYVKCNGTVDEDGNYSISGEHKYSDTTTITYYIHTNSDASTLSFESQENSTSNVTVVLLTLSYDETLHHIGMGNATSYGTDYLYGYIDNEWGHKSSNQYIYDYTYNLTYPSQATTYKELFTSKITSLFLGIDLYVLPDFASMEMLGFVNF